MVLQNIIQTFKKVIYLKFTKMCREKKRKLQAVFFLARPQSCRVDQKLHQFYIGGCHFRVHLRAFPIIHSDGILLSNFVTRKIVWLHP